MRVNSFKIFVFLIIKFFRKGHIYFFTFLFLKNSFTAIKGPGKGGFRSPNITSSKYINPFLLSLSKQFSNTVL